MKSARCSLCLFLILATLPNLLIAQTQTTASSPAVPRLVNYSGKATDTKGDTISGTTGISFTIYNQQEGGAPLWMETQNVTADSRGNYTVQLGASKSEGLPLDLFSSGEARWLGVRINSGEEQPRVLLLSVPYALKAADAQTLGGLPASAFVLAAPPSGGSTSASASLPAASGGTGTMQPDLAGSGTADYVPLWTPDGNTLGNSVMYQKGAGSTARIGINTTSPATTLDVKGTETVRGTLTLPATATATATAGKNSQPERMQASAYNSSTKAAVNQGFQWQAEPAGNNTASPSGTLNLLFGSGSAKPTETGLNLASNGIITFAPGQTFPGAGPGTITGVTAGTDLTGGGTSNNVTLNLDTTKVPQLTTANTFTGNNVFEPSATDAVDAYTSGPGKSALVGIESATSGGSYGVWSETFDSSGAGVKGINHGAVTSSSQEAIGTYGQSDKGIGVFGQHGSESTTGQRFLTLYNAAVWGDGGASESTGVFGTADENEAGRFVNNSAGFFTLSSLAENSSGSPFLAANDATGQYCDVDANGNLYCSGSKNAVVPVDGGQRRVALSAIESPKNWFEDAGSAQLVNGSAVVGLDPTFIQTVNTGVDYKVFPVPNGDCKGLYVTNKTATSFEVRELGGGTSNVAFDYRIMALRRNYETVRFADHTHDLDSMKLMEERGAKSVSHDTTNRLMTFPAKEASLAPHPVR